MTDYSKAAQANTAVPQNCALDFIPARDHRPVIEWAYPEFQSLCPVSDRHDQGTLTLRYQPREKILESKSMREYLSQWRTVRNWQEYICEEIADAVAAAIEPEWLVVEIDWSPRGGIFAKTTSHRGESPDDHGHCCS